MHPARLRQVTWTNPLRQSILLEAGIAANTQLYDFSYHRYVPGHQDIPRVVEFGSTVGMDSVSPLVNASSAIFGVQSGNLNNGLAARRIPPRRLPPARVDLACSGSHSAKFGYAAGFLAATAQHRGDTRLTIIRHTPPRV